MRPANGHDRELFETVHADENFVDDRWPLHNPGVGRVPGRLDEVDGKNVDEDDEDDEDETTFVCRAAYHPGSGEFVLSLARARAEAVRMGSSRHAVVRAAGQPELAAGGRGSSSSVAVAVALAAPPQRPRDAHVAAEPSGAAARRRPRRRRAGGAGWGGSPRGGAARAERDAGAHAVP